MPPTIALINRNRKPQIKKKQKAINKHKSAILVEPVSKPNANAVIRKGKQNIKLKFPG